MTTASQVAAMNWNRPVADDVGALAASLPALSIWMMRLSVSSERRRLTVWVIGITLVRAAAAADAR